MMKGFQEETERNIERLTAQLRSCPASGCGVKDAERLADEVLAAGGWDSRERSIPVKTIAECFGFRAYVQETIPDNAAGNIYVGGTTKKLYGHDKIIIAGKGEPFNSQRFILAHGLGHYLMDYVGSALEKTPGKLFSRAYTGESRGAGDIKELRADRFAEELLMPADEFAAEYAKVMKAVESDMRFAVPTLAAYFEAEERRVARRLSYMGLA